MCMNEPPIIMASTLCSGFGLRHSSCHHVIVGLAISCSKIGKKPAKNEVPPKYMCKRENDQ